MSQPFTPLALLERLAPMGPLASPQLLVAVSGGGDSAVLLDALARLRDDGALAGRRLEAFHVNHGLYPDADAWEAACRRTASERGVPLAVRRLALTVRPGESVEARAREARYAALLDVLEPGATLLTGHHADDQLETVLLALLRGAGPAGLAGMPAYRRRGRGWHVRPLLDFTREALTAYACAQGLAWVEDPSNADARLTRAWLREAVVPVLRRRWPGVAGSVGRSARLCAASDALDGVLACLDLGIGETGPGDPDADAGAAEGPRLAVARLAALSDVRRLNALRFWIRSAGHPAPPERRLRQAVADLLAGDPSGEGVARWDRTELRRYRDHLYLLPPLPTAGGADRRVDPRRSIALPPGLGDLALEVADGRVPRAWRLAAGALAGGRVTVGFRAGGERLRLPGRDGTRRLKRLLQEWGVVPWMRHRLPILRVDGEIAAVADLAVAAPFQAAAGEPALVVRWRRHPSVF